MTLQDFCKKYNYSQKTIKTSFNRTVQSMKNKGFILTRKGTWRDGDYIVIEDKSLIPKKEVVLSDRLVGQRFGHLTVIEDTGKRLHKSIIWKCKCDCGNEHNVTSNNLNGGQTKSCGKKECPYHKTFKDLTNQKFGKLTALYPTDIKDGSHMYWMCKCDCGNSKLKEVSSNGLQSGSVQSCGCIKTSIGEFNIENILKKNNIIYQTQVKFNDLKNINHLRFDFGIYNKKGQITRLIEFDGIQHYKKQEYFTHSFEEIKHNDNIKNKYAKQHNIPLVRIPYWERDNITLEMLLGEEYLIE